MKILKFSILALIIAIFTSCDCLQHIQGSVIDSKTRLPIEKVMIKENSRELVIHTDSLGQFEFTSMTGGLLGCPKISLSFELRKRDISRQERNISPVVPIMPLSF